MVSESEALTVDDNRESEEEFDYTYDSTHYAIAAEPSREGILEQELRHLKLESKFKKPSQRTRQTNS